MLGGSFEFETNSGERAIEWEIVTWIDSGGQERKSGLDRNRDLLSADSILVRTWDEETPSRVSYIRLYSPRTIDTVERELAAVAWGSDPYEFK